MRFGHPFHHGKAKPCAFHFSGSVLLPKAFPHIFKMLLFDTDTVIFNTAHGKPIFTRNRKTDMSVFLSVFHRIFQ